MRYMKETEHRDLLNQIIIWDNRTTMSIHMWKGDVTADVLFTHNYDVSRCFLFHMYIGIFIVTLEQCEVNVKILIIKLIFTLNIKFYCD